MVKLSSFRVFAPQQKVKPLFKIDTGYFSIECRSGEIKEVQEERALATLPEQDQKTIQLYTQILYAMVFGIEGLIDEDN